MTVLAIETATTLCGVAVAADGAAGSPARYAFRRQSTSTHSEMLLPLIADTLAELNLSPRDITAVVCGAGPGSFTGLRIGIATAKGLCFALAVPLVMVSSLQALAVRALAQVAVARPVLATLNAFRGQVFAQLLMPADFTPSPDLQRLLASQPRLTTDAAWDPTVLTALLQPHADALWLCGGGLISYPVLLSAGTQVPDDDAAPHPLSLLELGLIRLRSGEVDVMVTATPNYICASAAEEKAAALPATHSDAVVAG